MSLAESAVDLIAQAARRDGFVRVHVVHLELGALACVQPEALRQAFDAVSAGGVAAGARLEFVTIPGEGECTRCAVVSPIVEEPALCPVCRNAPVRVLSGTSMRIVDLEVE